MPRTARPTRRALPAIALIISALAVAGCASTHGLVPEGRPIDPDALAASRSIGPYELSEAAFPMQDW